MRIKSVDYLNFFNLDDLPMRGFIGHLEESGFLPHRHRTYLWTHLLFSFLYNGNNVCFDGFYPV